MRLFSLILILLYPSASWALPTAEVNVYVYGEDGSPVYNADVSVAFSEPASNGYRDFIKKDQTDSDGFVSISAGSLPSIFYTVSKDGYYDGFYQYETQGVEGIYGFRKYSPLHDKEIVTLKRKIEPHPLHVHRALENRSLVIPEMERHFGYDLIEGDWVAPYGLGVHSDFIFNLSGSSTDLRNFDVTLELTFDNPGDGIQSVFAPVRFGSKLRLPHKAPVDGYKSSLVQRYARTTNRLIAADFPEDKNYLFRVRTTYDEKGNIKSALYGKIHGNILFTHTGLISVFYYINKDTNQRNLEFDQKNNLHKKRDKNYWMGNIRP